jgi:uncharacterized membrane protein YagU involved in acid resistance
MSADAHNLTLGMSIPWVARLIHVSLYFVFCNSFVFIGPFGRVRLWRRVRSAIVHGRRSCID